MEPINSRDGRWSISLCTRDTIHLTYGNATVHILVRDLRHLGIAMQKMAEALEPISGENGSDCKKKELLQ